MSNFLRLIWGPCLLALFNNALLFTFFPGDVVPAAAYIFFLVILPVPEVLLLNFLARKM